MRLVDLLRPWITLEGRFDRTVVGLSLDSHGVKNGELFFACPGITFDGYDFVEQALRFGASAVVFDRKVHPGPVVRMENNVPFIGIERLNDHLSAMADIFFRHPSKKMNVVGVTGTNGKSSCVHYISNALNGENHRCASMGTLGVGFPDALNNTGYTTVDAVSQQRILFELHQKEVRYVAMEVSSHGLHQKRVEAVNFDIALFTNLSHDHLDYHGDMENYWQAKKRLFDFSSLSKAVINADDPYGRALIDELSKKNALEVHGYAVTREHLTWSSIKVKEMRYHSQGMEAKLESPWGYGVLNINLLGQFNLSNVMGVLTVLMLWGVPFNDALRQLNAMQAVPGRMQMLVSGQSPRVVVDYAHTPDALEKVLLSLRRHCERKLWCVFGCGGERDSEKRPKMGRIASHYSDYVILTNDNPRKEDPNLIIDHIRSGWTSSCVYRIELDRGLAIAYAISHAHPKDMVLIAGKGHETYQDIQGKKIPFNDIEEVKRCLK